MFLNETWTERVQRCFSRVSAYSGTQPCCCNGTAHTLNCPDLPSLVENTKQNSCLGPSWEPLWRGCGGPREDPPPPASHLVGQGTKSPSFFNVNLSVPCICSFLVTLFSPSWSYLMHWAGRNAYALWETELRMIVIKTPLKTLNVSQLAV